LQTTDATRRRLGNLRAMTHEHLSTVLADNLELSAERAAGLRNALQNAGDEPLETACRHCALSQDELLTIMSRHILTHNPRVRLAQVSLNPAALSYIPARDAWDYLLLPASVEPDGHLLCCTTEQSVPTALAYLMQHLPIPF